MKAGFSHAKRNMCACLLLLFVCCCCLFVVVVAHFMLFGEICAMRCCRQCVFCPGARPTHAPILVFLSMVNNIACMKRDIYTIDMVFCTLCLDILVFFCLHIFLFLFCFFLLNSKSRVEYSRSKRKRREQNITSFRLIRNICVSLACCFRFCFAMANNMYIC